LVCGDEQGAAVALEQPGKPTVAVADRRRGARGLPQLKDRGEVQLSCATDNGNLQVLTNTSRRGSKKLARADQAASGFSISASPCSEEGSER
jgi:hypothetical protein